MIALRGIMARQNKPYADETRYVASGEHVMKPVADVKDGEMMQGKYFPRVYPVGAVVT
jgi:hypothetical protein